MFIVGGVVDFLVFVMFWVLWDLLIVLIVCNLLFIVIMCVFIFFNMMVVIFVKIGVFLVSRMWMLVNVLLGFNWFVEVFLVGIFCVFGFVLEVGCEIIGFGEGEIWGGGGGLGDFIWLLIVWRIVLFLWIFFKFCFLVLFLSLWRVWGILMFGGLLFLWMFGFLVLFEWVIKVCVLVVFWLD